MRRALGNILIAAVIGATGSAALSAQKGSKCREWLTEKFFRRATVATVAARLDAGASPLARTPHNSGSTALHLAARFSANPDVIEALLEAWPDVEVRDLEGSTLLHSALHSTATSEPAVIEALLAAGAEVNVRGDASQTPLHRASYAGRDPERHPIVRALLAAGAEVNARDDADDTPLHRVVRSHHHTNVIEALLAAGADPSAKNNACETPTDVARAPAVIEILRTAERSGIGQ